MKVFRPILSILLVLLLLVPTVPTFAATDSSENGNQRIVNNSIIIDDDATGGYEGDYVVIYNPATSSSTSYSTGTMTGLIETTIEANVNPFHIQTASDPDRLYKIDVDSQLNALAQSEVQSVNPPLEPVEATSYSVGDTKTFRILQSYSPTGSSSVSFECLYVGSHCYIWTPVSSSNNTYPLDEIDSSYAKLAADEFDSKFDLMQSSFGNHTNGSQGDGKLHMLYYNINDGWQPGQGYVAGFFYQVDITNNSLPILNIDTYPGVYYKNSAGTEYKRMDDTYNTMVHEYQHLINYSNTSGMSSWLNECFSAAAEEICYPGSSVVGRIQSWEEYYYSDNGDWLNPPKEFMYDSANSLHTGYSMYNWSNSLDNNSILALYSQVSFFAQYLFTRFGNTIYKQISNKYSSSEVSAITSATGVSCADLVRDFRVAVTANAAQSQYNGVYGFKAQDGYDPTQYNNVQNPWDLLGPVIFTGTSCSIKGGGAITVKPKNGVYNPPSGANSNMKYIGIKLASVYTVTAVSNNTAWGTVSVDGIKITATPATGYYVSGYEVVSGTATATVSGNIITVTPESDCTIRVIFAPKPSYTVNFVAAGNNEGSQTAFDGDTITLPSSVSVNAEGWTFSGWTDMQVPDETTVKPGYLAPGASYTVTANATLYALYTRVEEGAGEIGYELVSIAPTDWTGNYVITYGTDTDMYVMTGVSPSSNGATIESAANATTYANAGVALTGSKLTNVANSYIFKLAKHGNYYSIQSASTNAYVGEDSSSYLAGYTSYASGSCDWTPGTLDNASSATHANNGSYPLLGFSTGSGYFWSGSISSGSSAAKNVRFWRENGGDLTYYTTDPVAAVGLVVTIASGDAAFEYDGTLKTNHQYTVTVEGEAVEADETGLTFTLPTGDVLTITPADTAAVTHVKEGAVENAFTWSFDGNEDQYFVLETYGTLTVTPHAITLTVVGNHDTVVYNGKSQNVKGWTLEWDDDLFGSARPTSIIEHLDPPIGEKAWMAKGTEPGTYYMNIDVSEAYLQQVDTSETAAHFVDDFAPTWEVVDGYLVIVSAPAFKTQALALEGQIGVYFYLDLPQTAAYEYEGVAFTIDNIDGMDAFVEFSPDMPTNDNGYYQFVYYVRSIEMADTIFATLHYTLNGEDQTLEKTYSVKAYFETYDDYTDLFSEAEQAMTEATADYGHYVQAFLDTQKNWAVGTDYAEMDKHYADYTAEDISAVETGLADYVTAKELGTNVAQINYTLVLDSDTQLLVLFTPAKGYTGTFAFTANGETVTADGEKISVVQQNDGRYLMTIKNIGAHELANVYEIKAIDDDGDESTMTVSPLSYVNFIMTSYADDTAAVNAAVAIWRYAMAAKALRPE